MLHMSQNCYDIRIIGSLLKKENHIRGLAKELKTNQTTIARKLKELFEENVVDYKREGRNKVYFLKKSLEAFQMILILENYKLIELLEKYPYLRRIIQTIKQNKKIKLAIIFGSYTKGAVTRRSDIDIFIETQNRRIKEEIEDIDSRISVKIGNLGEKNLLVGEIIKDHIIIKGVEYYYEKIGFI